MNKQRYAAILKQIEAHPETWDQECYHNACGTAHCVAGWAEVHALAADGRGAKPNRDRTWFRACRWLEVNGNEGPYLFSHHRTLDELRAVAKDGFPDWVYEDLTEAEDAR